MTKREIEKQKRTVVKAHKGIQECVAKAKDALVAKDSYAANVAASDALLHKVEAGRVVRSLVVHSPEFPTEKYFSCIVSGLALVQQIRKEVKAYQTVQEAAQTVLTTTQKIDDIQGMIALIDAHGGKVAEA